jgi:23S rRNA (uridine2552-2'-O)-methyltransferase
VSKKSGGGYKPKDHFFHKAKTEGLRARSAFKLDEIAERFHLFPKGARVLDLGAAPGGFLQILAREVGPKGFVLGVDLVPIRPLGIPNVKTAALDVLADDFDATIEAMHPEAFDAVVSDLAPKTTGVRDTDEARSLRLAGKALEISLRKGTARVSYVAKLFMGRDFESFRNEVRAGYEDVKVVRPEATRGASIEVYIVGMRRKP